MEADMKNIVFDKLKSLICEKESPVERQIKDMAESYWNKGADLDYIGIYMTDFGEHQLIPLTRDQVDMLKGST
jgi:hypothetical protein